jgi:hypothetical protein
VEHPAEKEDAPERAAESEIERGPPGREERER